MPRSPPRAATRAATRVASAVAVLDVNVVVSGFLKENKRTDRSRRRLLAALLGAPLLAQAQQVRRRIGVLLPAGSDRPLAEFRSRLAMLGWKQGANLAIELRSADNRLERLPALAQELVASKVDLIVAASTPGARAAKAATSTLPIVFTLVSDPVGSGLVATLAHPGGNATGIATLAIEIAPKWIEYLKLLVPKLERVAHLSDTGMGPAVKQMSAQIERAATRLGVVVATFDAARAEDLAPAFAAAARGRVAAMVVPPSPLFLSESKRIAQLALQHRIATVHGARPQVAAGGLLSYGVDFVESFGRAARYVDSILRGAKPAELPVEQVERFQLVVNLRTAAELGLNVPPLIKAQATELIE
jgi:putative ABC transport system substrate-binding protein